MLQMKSAVLWGITRLRVVIVYRRFGTTYRSHFFAFLFGLLTRENRTDKLSRNVGKELTTRSLVISQKGADLTLLSDHTFSCRSCGTSMDFIWHWLIADIFKSIVIYLEVTRFFVLERRTT
jgi:hypothetical protein